jgi:hypothetical protein
LPSPSPSCPFLADLAEQSPFRFGVADNGGGRQRRTRERGPRVRSSSHGDASGGGDLRFVLPRLPKALLLRHADGAILRGALRPLSPSSRLPRHAHPPLSCFSPDFCVFQFVDAQHAIACLSHSTSGLSIVGTELTLEELNPSVDLLVSLPFSHFSFLIETIMLTCSASVNILSIDRTILASTHSLVSLSKTLLDRILGKA